MNCERHTEIEAAGYCTDCNCKVCEACLSREEGYIYCLDCTERRASGLDQNTVLLLWFFLGIFGGHRFYAGQMFLGFLQLSTLGGLGFWTAFDLYLILTRQFKDSEGRFLIDRS